MNKKVLIIICFLLCLANTILVIHAVLITSEKNTGIGIRKNEVVKLRVQEDELQKLVEEYRESIDAPIEPDAFTCHLAKQRSAEVQADFSHSGFSSRVAEGKIYEGTNYYSLGENLARGFNAAQDVMVAWYASPTHFELLNVPKFNKGCVECTETTCALIFAEERQ